jgi:phosphatidylserine/phosphatidylglycerophosphate/cardiolipin synthase-like enzyme
MRIESGKDVGKHVVERLFNAKNYAYICSPYISRDYARKIVALARDDVNVKVLTTSQSIEDDFFIRSYFLEEKEADGLDNLHHLVLKRTSTNGIFHAKLYVIDDTIAMSGSANLTDPGMKGNREIMHISETPQEVQVMKAVFEKFWQEATFSVYGDSRAV